MDSTSRLRIATRIHFALLRHYSEDVAVSALLEDEGVAREVLWVCAASGHDELVALGKKFSAANKPMPKVARTPVPPSGAMPQEMAWAQDTSGFGISVLPGTPAERPAKPSPWRSLARLLPASLR